MSLTISRIWNIGHCSTICVQIPNICTNPSGCVQLPWNTQYSSSETSTVPLFGPLSALELSLWELFLNLLEKNVKEFSRIGLDNYIIEVEPPWINMQADNDWIVHLDEETLVTEASVIGIVNFINEGKYSFGQGVITYANEEIISWITTIADLVRVGMDYGMIRFSLK